MKIYGVRSFFFLTEITDYKNRHYDAKYERTDMVMDHMYFEL